MIVLIAVDVFAAEERNTEHSDPSRYRVSALVLGQTVTGLGGTLHHAVADAMDNAREFAERAFPDDTLRFTMRSILPE